MSETTNLKLFKQDNPTTNTNNFDIEKTLNDNWDKLDENAGSTNEKIEKNAEGIAQNKKDVDEELTKIKKENSLMKSQIPTGTASGNNIHLEDSSNMDFEWKLRGWSRQETRSGKNLFDNTVEPQFISNAKKEIINTGERIILTAKTFSYAIFKVEKNIREYAGKTVRLKMDFSKSNANLNPKYGVLLGSSDYSNREVKGESTVSGYTITFNLPSELENEKEYLFVRLYATQNNEGNIENYVDYTKIILTIDNENMSYEAFGVSPSPEYPSKIENVGDNINLFNKNDTNCIFDTAISNNTLEIKASGTYKTVYVPCKANTIYSISKKYDEIKNRLTVACSNDMPNYSKKVENLGGSEMATNLTVTTSNTAKYLLAYVWVSGGSTTYQEMLDSIKIEEGIKATNYSDYNCGSVGVTISNKNLYKIEKVINDTNYSKIIYKDENGNVSFTTGGIPLIIAPTKTKEKTEYTYILKCKSNVTTENNINFTAIYEDGTSKLLSANKKKDTNEFIVKFKTDKEKTLAYVTQQYTNSSRTTIITEGTMILEGDYLNLDEPYEIHQEQEIIFPLAEGQKLYEGSYLEKDGIHNIRTQIKLLSSGGNLFVSALGTYQVFGKTQKGIKQGSRLLSNYFKDYGSVNAIKDAVGIANNNSTDRIYVSNGISTTLDEFKDWLNKCENAGRPVILEYELAEEEIIPYTQEQKNVIDKILYTYKNVTNISVDDELATLDITYKKDIETMFNNQANECNERLSNIENLLNTTETSALLLDNLEDDLEKEV